MKLSPYETEFLARRAVKALGERDAGFWQKAKERFPWVTPDLVAQEKVTGEKRTKHTRAFAGILLLALVGPYIFPDSIAPLDTRIWITQGLLIIDAVYGLWNMKKHRSPFHDAYLKRTGDYRDTGIQTPGLDDLL